MSVTDGKIREIVMVTFLKKSTANKSLLKSSTQSLFRLISILCHFNSNKITEIKTLKWFPVRKIMFNLPHYLLITTAIYLTVRHRFKSAAYSWREKRTGAFLPCILLHVRKTIHPAEAQRSSNAENTSD